MFDSRLTLGMKYYRIKYSYLYYDFSQDIFKLARSCKGHKPSSVIILKGDKSQEKRKVMQRQRSGQVRSCKDHKPSRVIILKSNKSKEKRKVMQRQRSGQVSSCRGQKLSRDK